MTPIPDDVAWARYTRVDEPHKCWEWAGFKNGKGYGQLCRRGVCVKAHRLAWSIFNGPIPDGLIVRHRCDNPGCVNPHHLELGTVLDNNRDRDERGRTARLERHPRWKPELHQ